MDNKLQSYVHVYTGSHLHRHTQTIFYGGFAYTLLDRSRFVGVIPLISGRGFPKFFFAQDYFFLQPQYLKNS